MADKMTRDRALELLNGIANEQGAPTAHVNKQLLRQLLEPLTAPIPAAADDVDELVRRAKAELLDAIYARANALLCSDYAAPWSQPGALFKALAEFRAVYPSEPDPKGGTDGQG